MLWILKKQPFITMRGEGPFSGRWDLVFLSLGFLDPGNLFSKFQDVWIKISLNLGPQDFMFLSPGFWDQDPSTPSL